MKTLIVQVLKQDSMQQASVYINSIKKVKEV